MQADTSTLLVSVHTFIINTTNMHYSIILAQKLVGFTNLPHLTHQNDFETVFSRFITLIIFSFKFIFRYFFKVLTYVIDSAIFRCVDAGLKYMTSS